MLLAALADSGNEGQAQASQGGVLGGFQVLLGVMDDSGEEDQG